VADHKHYLGKSQKLVLAAVVVGTAVAVAVAETAAVVGCCS